MKRKLRKRWVVTGLEYWIKSKIFNRITLSYKALNHCNKQIWEEKRNPEIYEPKSVQPRSYGFLIVYHGSLRHVKEHCMPKHAQLFTVYTLGWFQQWCTGALCYQGWEKVSIWISKPWTKLLRKDETTNWNQSWSPEKRKVTNVEGSFCSIEDSVPPKWCPPLSFSSHLV